MNPIVIESRSDEVYSIQHYVITFVSESSVIFSWYLHQLKLELWVTSLSDTPRLQYYDVQTLEYRYISKIAHVVVNPTYEPVTDNCTICEGK
jgi:hypothetical protein